MIQNLIFKIIFLKKNFRAYNFVHTFQWVSSEFLFQFQIFSRESLSQQKLPKKVFHFTIQFRSKNLTHYMNLNSLDIENNMLLQHSQKPFWIYKKISSKHVSVLCQKKTFALHRFLTPKAAFLKHFQSKCPFISVYLRKKRHSEILSD